LIQEQDVSVQIHVQWRGWPLLLMYVVRKWDMSCVIVFENERYTASTSIWGSLCFTYQCIKGCRLLMW